VRARINERFLKNTLKSVSTHNKREEEADCWRQHELQQHPLVKCHISGSLLAKAANSTRTPADEGEVVLNYMMGGLSVFRGYLLSRYVFLCLDAKMREYWARKKAAESGHGSGSGGGDAVGAAQTVKVVQSGSESGECSEGEVSGADDRKRPSSYSGSGSGSGSDDDDRRGSDRKRRCREHGQGHRREAKGHSERSSKRHRRSRSPGYEKKHRRKHRHHSHGDKKKKRDD
jgi:hypothetical protein